MPSSAIPVILMYHSVTSYQEDPYLVTVSPERFDQQMRWLRKRGLRGTSIRDLLQARARSDGRGLVGLTFDDGYADFASCAVPILRRYGFTATVFPVAGLLGGDNAWDVKGPRKPLLTAGQVREVADAGMEIGSHGLRHISLTSATGGELTAEIGESRRILREASGQDVAGFCYPYGAADEQAVDRVRAAGYAYGCAIWRSGLTGLHALPRIFVGESDTAPRLWAKGVRHWLRWGYRGPGAPPPVRLSTGPPEQSRA
jgi:peptidoglycan/xylan/chitin deacetylase (PgdA/CDA1 family)